MQSLQQATEKMKQTFESFPPKFIPVPMRERNPPPGRRRAWARSGVCVGAPGTYLPPRHITILFVAACSNFIIECLIPDAFSIILYD